jgi:trigger factor
MKIDIDELSPVQRKVRVELPAETVAGEFSRAYKNLSQRVRVKGFRSGKIPRNVLQGMYGDEVKGEVRSHLVEESLGEIVKDRNLQIVSRPEVETAEFNESGPFSFSAVFEVKPDFEVKNYLGMEVEKVTIAITEAQVEEALQRLQEGHARLELVEGREVVQKGDFVTLDFEGTMAGKPFAGGKGENYMLEVGAGQALPQFEDVVVGLRLGERQTVAVNYPENYPNKEIAGKAVDFSIVAREIKQKVLPVLDDEFAKDHGECASLDELKTRIRERLEHELGQYQKEELKEKLVSRLIEAHPFAIPPSMVERQTRYLMERYQNQVAAQRDAESPAPMEEVRKNLEPRAMRQVQATLLVEKIAQLEHIEISERAKTLREVYARAEARDDLRAQMVFERTLEYLLERAIVKEVDRPISKVDEQAEKR